MTSVETDQIGGAPGDYATCLRPGTFIGTETDTPVSCAGQAGKVLVNSGETGLEWGSGGGSGSRTGAI